MIVHTAAWRLCKTTLTCGHALAIRAGERHAWCSWCSRTVGVPKAA